MSDESLLLTNLTKSAPQAPAPASTVGSGEAPPPEVKLFQPITCEEELKQYWLAFESPGYGFFFGRFDAPNLPKWEDQAAVATRINHAIAEREIVKIHWPILVKKVDVSKEMYLAQLPPPDRMHKTIFRESFVHFDMSKITFWTTVHPLQNESVLKFFRAYFEDVGGRIVAPPPGAQLGGGPLSGMPMSQRRR